MRITKTRLDLINAVEDEIVKVQVIDKVDETKKALGTTIEIFVPMDL